MKRIFLIVVLLLFPINVCANNIEIESKSAIVVNRKNDEILFEIEKDEKLPIASLTKIMTVLLTLENINSLEDSVIVKESDINNLNGYQVIGLTSGLAISYKDLIYSTLMYSAADSANVLANNVFDNYDIFINKMNDLAAKIGMNNTNFSNPIGFDNNNYSTSYDLFLLLDYALDNENFYEVFTKITYKVEALDKSIKNNIIENDNIKINGYKGGYTSKSGLSLSAITTIDDNELIIITIGAAGEIDSQKNIKDSLLILNNIKESHSNKVILEKDKLIDNIIYKEGNNETNYEIRSNKTIKYFLKNDIDLNYIKIYYEGKTILDSTIKTNEEIGKIKIYYEDKLLDSISVTFNKKYLVKESKNYKNLIIFIGICLIGLIVFRKKK